MTKQETDFARWENLDRFWPERSEIIVNHIPQGSNVIDLGAGMQQLKEILPNNCTYQAVDLFARDDDTIICDFNQGEFPDIEFYDVVVCQGLFEYIHDIKSFMTNFKNYSGKLICTYHIKTPTSEKADEWFNQYTLPNFCLFFNDAGFSLNFNTELPEKQDNHLIFCWEK